MTPFEGPEIGQRVSHYRRMNGWSMADLERQTGGFIKRDVIANIETRRKKDITVAQMMALAAALGVPPVALLLPIEKPFERVEVGGWNRSINALRHVFAGDGAWSPTAPTPAGQRAVRLIISADQLEENQLRISMALSRLLDELSEGRLRALLANPSLSITGVAAAVGEELAADAWELVRDVRTYTTLRDAFADLGGEGAPAAPWDSWMTARFGDSSGTAADSTQ